MKIYKFPMKYPSCIYKEESQEYHLVDLEYIVSIGPVTTLDVRSFGAIGKSNATFLIYIKIGHPIPIEYSVEYLSDVNHAAQFLKEEREKLIKAWEEKDTYNATTE